MSSSAPARVVFGLLVVSTVGAFFVTQRLKRTPPPVKRIVVPHYIAPKAAGPTKTAEISFTLPKADNVTISVVNPNDDEVRRLLDDRHLDAGVHDFTWNGHDASGQVPADGAYFVRIVLHGQGRAVTSPKPMLLVTKPPRARIVSVTPARVSAAGPVSVSFKGPAGLPARFTVYRTDPSPVRAVATFAAAARSHVGVWDGRIAGRSAPPGIYTFAVTVESQALVSGSWPARLPPTPAAAAAGTGLTISGPAAAGPLEPVAAGGVATIDVTGARGAVRWTLRRVGDRHAVGRGISRAPYVRVAAPSRITSGIYEVSAAGATYPLAIQGHARQRVLLVVPALTWQALNPIDGDDDGFADTLGDSSSVVLDRPFAYGREPAGFVSEVAPMARFLDARHLAYDVTTDVALARGRGPGFAGHKAVVLAGSMPWTTSALDDALRGYVAAGGRVALFGVGNFRGRVTLTGDRVALAPPPHGTPFGDQTSASASEAAPLVVASDDAGLFAQTSGYIGLFTNFDQTDRLPPGASIVAAAGRIPGHPAFVVYRLGQGVVARVGTSQWAAALDDAQVADVTGKLWALLSA